MLRFKARIRETGKVKEVVEISYLKKIVMLKLNESYLIKTLDEVELLSGTGFLDKSGREIFEGDVVKIIPYGFKAPEVMIGTVLWNGIIGRFEVFVDARNILDEQYLSLGELKITSSIEVEVKE